MLIDDRQYAQKFQAVHDICTFFFCKRVRDDIPQVATVVDPDVELRGGEGERF